MLAEKTKTCFKIKANLSTIPVLHLIKDDLSHFVTQLTETINKSPHFFLKTPVILELHDIAQSSRNIDFARIYAALKEQQLIPLGVRGGNSIQHQCAEQAGFIVLPEAKKDKDFSLTSGEPKAVATQRSNSKLITQPVRSGQQIYAKGCDLIVVGAVSHGAELLADGHIHIYGTLRGRALAGIHGDKDARIFCHRLEAELVSIAGYYLVDEEIKQSETAQAVQIMLENERLKIETL